jgi:peptidoglycan/LPS O-acetylase OafA/YrhL
MSVDTGVAVEQRGSARLHLDFVDGLRAISALYVMFHHIWQFSIAAPTASPPSWFRAANVFKQGAFAVAVFLVVSGFCLMLPVVRSPQLQLPGGMGAFAKRRAIRILPAYYAALGLSVLLIVVFSELRRTSGTPWDITLPNFTFAKTVSHLFLVHNWFGDLRWAFDPPLWTVALEFQIYFVFALVLLPCWRRFGAIATMGFAFTTGVALTYLGAGAVAPWMLGLFSLGMFAAFVATSPDGAFARLRGVRWGWLAAIGVVLIPLVTVAGSRLDSSLTAAMIEETVVGLATAAGLIAMTLRQVARPSEPSPVMKALAWHPVRFVGQISYSLYLIHYPIVAAVALVIVRGRNLSVPASFAVLTVICVPLVLAATYGFHLLFERPYLVRRAGTRHPAVAA